MSEAFAALLFRPDEVSDEALSLGVAMAIAGYALEKPRLDVAAIEGAKGWSVAFYASGEGGPAHTPEDEIEHCEELFGDEDLPPGLAVHAAALALGSPRAVVYALQHAPELEIDEAFRFGGDEGNEGEGDERDEGNESDEGGSAIVSRELGLPVLAALIKALFFADKRLTPRLAPADAAGVSREVRGLIATLGRVEGRGAFSPPALWGSPAPAPYRALVEAYDWADPADPPDVFRGISIGNLEGSVRFLRPPAIGALGEAPQAARGLYPFGELLSSNLADPRRQALLALDSKGEAISVVTQRGKVERAGLSLGELLRYLALGIRARSPFEEELIQSIQLRAAAVTGKLRT